jgi:NhaA family Na+:H+ antiporter
VGLEIRRELFEGELSTPRRAALPAALRVLLLAVAIIDDIGAILVIALFYSSGVAWSGLVIVGVGIVTVLVMQRVGVRNPFLYVAPGIVVWGGMLQAGIHPTIAGVILGLLTPVRSWFGHEGFVVETERALERLRSKAASEMDPRKLLPELGRINIAQREAVPPLTRIEVVLHPWVAFGIMPLFALANAGVSLGGLNLADGSSEATGIALGVGLGLVVGKPLGIVAFSWLPVRIGLASLPRGVSWAGVVLVGCVAGIGFTMSLFIGALAFMDASMSAIAKLTVLAASAFAGMVGLVVGYRFLPRGPST